MTRRRIQAMELDIERSRESLVQIGSLISYSDIVAIHLTDDLGIGRRPKPS